MQRDREKASLLASFSPFQNFANDSHVCASFWVLATGFWLDSHLWFSIMKNNLISGPSMGKDCQGIWASPETRAFYHVLVKVVRADVPHIKANSSLERQKREHKWNQFGPLYSEGVAPGMQQTALGVLWCPDTLSSFVLITVLSCRFTWTFCMCLMCSMTFQKQMVWKALPVPVRMCPALKH